MSTPNPQPPFVVASPAPVRKLRRTSKRQLPAWVHQYIPDRMADMFAGRSFYKNIDWSNGGSGATGVDGDKNRVECYVDDAEVISSRNATHPDLHSVMIDIDRHNVWLTPSSTPGNWHLYIHKAIQWEHYLELLEVLAKCGIIEVGYLEASKRRGATFLRVPWLKKGAEKLSTPAQIEAFLQQPAPEPASPEADLPWEDLF